mgnify:CR=1 FL=1
MPLNRALARLNRMGALTAGVPPDETLFEELAKGRPVGVRIQWNGTGNGHFVMVTGFSDNDRGNVTLEIDDPFYGHSTVRKDMFPGSYQTIGGAWTHTYQTV